MSYTTVQQALLDALRQVEGFSVENTAIADERILNRGAARTGIIRYGGLRMQPQGTYNRWAIEWTLIIDLWFRGPWELPEYNQIIGETIQAMIEQFIGRPTLGGTAGVTQVLIGDASDPERWQGELRNYWIVGLPVLVTEMQTIPIQEGA